MIIIEKIKLDTKIDKLSETNISKLRPASRKLFTMYLSTLINESLLLDMLDTAISVDKELEEVFNNVKKY